MRPSSKLHVNSAFLIDDSWYWSVDWPLMCDMGGDIVSVRGDIIIWCSLISDKIAGWLHTCRISSGNQCHSLPWFIHSQSHCVLIDNKSNPLDIISLWKKSKSPGGQTYWRAWLAQESTDLFFKPQKLNFVVLQAQARRLGASIVSTQSSALLAMLVRLLSRYTLISCWSLSSPAGFVLKRHHRNRPCRWSLPDLESAGHKELILCSSFVQVTNILIPATSSVASAASSLKCLEISSPSSQKPTGIAIKDDS